MQSQTVAMVFNYEERNILMRLTGRYYNQGNYRFVYKDMGEKLKKDIMQYLTYAKAELSQKNKIIEQLKYHLVKAKCLSEKQKQSMTEYNQIYQGLNNWKNILMEKQHDSENYYSYIGLIAQLRDIRQQKLLQFQLSLKRANNLNYQQQQNLLWIAKRLSNIKQIQQKLREDQDVYKKFLVQLCDIKQQRLKQFQLKLKGTNLKYEQKKNIILIAKKLLDVNQLSQKTKDNENVSKFLTQIFRYGFLDEYPQILDFQNKQLQTKCNKLIKYVQQNYIEIQSKYYKPGYSLNQFISRLVTSAYKKQQVERNLRQFPQKLQRILEPLFNQIYILRQNSSKNKHTYQFDKNGIFKTAQIKKAQEESINQLIVDFGQAAKKIDKLQLTLKQIKLFIKNLNKPNWKYQTYQQMKTIIKNYHQQEFKIELELIYQNIQNSKNKKEIPSISNRQKIQSENKMDNKIVQTMQKQLVRYKEENLELYAEKEKYFNSRQKLAAQINYLHQRQAQNNRYIQNTTQNLQELHRQIQRYKEENQELKQYRVNSNEQRIDLINSKQRLQSQIRQITRRQNILKQQISQIKRSTNQNIQYQHIIKGWQQKYHQLKTKNQFQVQRFQQLEQAMRGLLSQNSQLTKKNKYHQKKIQILQEQNSKLQNSRSQHKIQQYQERENVFSLRQKEDLLKNIEDLGNENIKLRTEALSLQNKFRQIGNLQNQIQQLLAKNIQLERQVNKFIKLKQLGQNRQIKNIEPSKQLIMENKKMKNDIQAYRIRQQELIQNTQILQRQIQNFRNQFFEIQERYKQMVQEQSSQLRQLKQVKNYNVVLQTQLNQVRQNLVQKANKPNNRQIEMIQNYKILQKQLEEANRLNNLIKTEYMNYKQETKNVNNNKIQEQILNYRENQNKLKQNYKKLHQHFMSQKQKMQQLKRQNQAMKQERGSSDLSRKISPFDQLAKKSELEANYKDLAQKYETLKFLSQKQSAKKQEQIIELKSKLAKSSRNRNGQVDQEEAAILKQKLPMLQNFISQLQREISNLKSQLQRKQQEILNLRHQVFERQN